MSDRRGDLLLPETYSPDTLREAFPEPILIGLRNRASADVPARVRRLTASGPLPRDPYDADRVAERRVQRAAWEAYTATAKATGVLDEDVIRRLRSPRHDQFVAAMAECMATWVLGDLGFSVGPRTTAAE